MIREIVEFLSRMAKSGSQMQRDAMALRAEIADFKKELIPFSHEEMELLSLSSVSKGKKRGFFKIKKGVFNTIHFEALVGYAVKEYTPQHRVILVATSDREIIYLIKGNVTNVYFDGKELGYMDQNGRLFNTRKQLIAEIDGNDNIPTHTVHIKGVDFGFITNPKFEERKEIKRAFQMLRPMDEDELSIFLCLTLINLVEESLL